MLRIAWSGQHTCGKALNVLIMALRSHMQDVAVDILGDGKCRKRFARLAVSLGVDRMIKWHGWLSKDMAQSIVHQADIFVITSVRDLTSTVLLEALSLGKPVVCLDHCGFSDVVDESCGVKIPVGKPKDVIKGFARAIERLKDDGLRRRLSEGARRRARKYAWTEKCKYLQAIYGVQGKKVVVADYACSPYRGSEPGMGWNYLKAIAAENEVWAIVEEEKWKEDIEKYLVENPEEMKNVHWEFIHKPRARLLRKIWPPSYYWFYRVWTWRAYKRALALHKEVHFDIAHQLNMVTFREPGYLWKLPIRFVWGPVGGLGYTDVRLFGLLGIVGSIEFAARNIINWLHCHCMRRPRLAALKAAATGSLIAATSENQREMRNLWGVDSVVMCEIGT